MDELGREVTSEAETGLEGMQKSDERDVRQEVKWMIVRVVV